VQPGDTVAKGQKLGLIKFGSRVDLFFPPEAEVLVSEGQQLYGGQTLLARWK
jgi:phosphatidylserine decarboxylase